MPPNRPIAGAEAAGACELERFLPILFACAEAATDPFDRASWEDHACAAERLIDYGKGVP